MEYTIGEFSKCTGLGIHTLRYYEHEGLITPSRTEKNRRFYRESDIAWVAFIKRLKATGMPIREIQQYAKLRAQGNDTLRERLTMLLTHREALEKEIASLQEHKRKLDEKIAYYQGEIALVMEK